MPTQTPPSDGDRTIKRPQIPEWLLQEGAEPSEEIVTVPESAESLSDLSLVVDGMEVLADTVGAADEGVSVDADDLDVPGGDVRLLELLREQTDGLVTSSDAHDLATDAADDALDVSRRMIRNWLEALADEGVLDRDEDTHPNTGVGYQVC